MSLAARQPGKFELAGAADPVPARLDLLEKECGYPAGFRRFGSDRELLSADQFADVVIIGTQDAHHAAPCLAAMERGYDILLEKPIAASVEDIRLIHDAARRLGRKVLVCHVLRYTPFYRKAKEMVASGMLGEIVSIRATEGVGPWHQAHSYVRGHWAVTGRGTPMIIAKCCHDLDIILWLMNDRCVRVASFGSLQYFRPEQAPPGAPGRCTDGCSHAATCPYDAHRYLREERKWLGYIHDGESTASDDEIRQWLARSPWGRCVYHCDNDAVDRQVVAMDFSRGGTAVLTMTAFGHGRDLEVSGTRGVLRGGAAVKADTGADFVWQPHGGEATLIRVAAVEGGYDGHGGGDAGLVDALDEEMRRSSPDEMTSSLSVSVESHYLGFAAEEARHTGRIVCLPVDGPLASTTAWPGL
jgi:predicted dehydrogenase